MLACVSTTHEIMGDLNLEFAAPQKAEELPLADLGSSLGSGCSGQLGKYTTDLVSPFVGGKMPGGFNLMLIKGYLGPWTSLLKRRVASRFDYGAAEAFGLRVFLQGSPA
jgi:3-oxoacyl-ACP reductase-like protein